MTLRIAMWSGPRNLSSALMRSFSARGDCAVRDEPFYGAYLAETGLDHPMRAEILATCETDWRKVADDCAGGGAGAGIVYQKHMTHHMLPGFSLDWTAQVRNAFLIRAPERVLASYAVKRESPSLADLGYARQADIFSRECDRLGHAPPVIAAEDVRQDPAGVLARLCAALGIPWTPRMLGWPAGPHPDDGVWAEHWYDGLWSSTGFGGPEAPGLPTLPDALRDVADAARPLHDLLSRHRILPP